MARATGLGAASSSCSYAAIAIAKSLFQKGASAASALAFQFASTNLVWELGLVLWVLIGWQFTLAEYLGGIVMIALMWLLLRVFVSPDDEAVAREHAHEADAGHQHHAVGSDLPWRERLTSAQAWSDVAHNFRGDWQMLWKEILTGFLLAGFIALLGDDFFNGLFLDDAPAAVQTLWGAFIGPVIAVLSFVCSVGNVPLAAVLWSGGLSFAGVMAFIFADLIVLPIILAYRKYYGTALRPADHRADARDDDPRGARRRPRLQRAGPHPRRAADDQRRLRLDPARLQARPERLRDARLRRAHRPHRAPRRDRPGVRHERRPGHGAAPRARRPHALLLLRALPGDVRRRARQVASRRTMAVTPTTTITPRSTAGCSRRP